jgi:L-alanine-DL-glutamate epimerase-like enolase superfamily enzyme
MKIKTVRATSHEIPVQIPLLKEPEKQNCIHVCVETDEGIQGNGFFSGRLFKFLSNRIAARELVNSVIGPTLVGQDAMNTDAIMGRFLKRFDLRDTVGVVTNAMSGIDIALWDVKGKALQQPVYKLLGGYSARVPVYATFGLLSYGREQLVEVAKMRMAEGHDKLKMLVCIDNSNNIREDAARVKALREGVGDQVEIMVDANQRFSLFQATELAHRIEPYGVSWFEEPVTHNYPPEMRTLRSRTKIPLAAGQTWGSAWQGLQFMEARAVDIAQIDVIIGSGFTESIKVAHLAEAFDLPLATHGWPLFNMHLAAATAAGYRVEFHVGVDELAKLIFVNAPKPEKGWVTCPDKPGLGLELNEDNLKKYQDK